MSIKCLKIIVVAIAAILVLTLAACGNKPTEAPSDEPASESEGEEPAGEETEGEEPAAEETAGEEGERVMDKVLVVYYSATGTTRGVAEKIAAVTGGDIYEIKAAQEYTADDLNWHDSNSRTTHEQNDPSVRPEIGSEEISLDGYSTIYIGYPIWWGEEPRIMDTFVESYNFDGITMVPFCTSGGSSIGRSGKNLEENAGSGIWLEGDRLSGSISEGDLANWIDSL